MFYRDAIIMLDSMELRGILADMGYKLAIKAKDTYAALLTTKKAVVGIPLKDEYPDGTVLTLDSFISGNPQIINCGDNKELFIAISALSDNHPQLYRWVIKNDTKEWVQITNKNMRDIASNLHKYSFASEAEIIEKFSKK
jgi:hypothetical protein